LCESIYSSYFPSSGSSYLLVSEDLFYIQDSLNRPHVARMTFFNQRGFKDIIVKKRSSYLLASEDLFYIWDSLNRPHVAHQTKLLEKLVKPTIIKTFIIKEKVFTNARGSTQILVSLSIWETINFTSSRHVFIVHCFI